MTKFVEWPVVESVPRRSVVLYTGQSYFAPGLMSTDRCGRNQMMGANENRTFGWDSTRTFVCASH